MSLHDHFSSPSTTDHEVDTPHEHEVPEATSREMGKRILFRVMNLDDHSGVLCREENGTVTYIVDNQQYPDQGDFAFGHAETGFQDATTRAYPRSLHNVHAVEVGAEDVVEPYPDEAPGLVYIKNGATVKARPVPRHIIDSYIDQPGTTPVDFSQQITDELFPPEATI